MLRKMELARPESLKSRTQDVLRRSCEMRTAKATTVEWLNYAGRKLKNVCGISDKPKGAREIV